MEEFIEFAQAKKANEREAKANESEAKSEKKDQGVEIVQNQPNIAEAKNIAEPNAVPAADAIDEEETEETAAAILFRTQSNLIENAIEYLETRFGCLDEEPLCWFDIFIYDLWPPSTSGEHFENYGNEDLEKLLSHFENILDGGEIEMPRVSGLI